MFTRIMSAGLALTAADREAIDVACAAYVETEMAEPVVLPAPSAIEAEPEGARRLGLCRALAVWLQSHSDTLLLPLAFYAAPAVPERKGRPAIPSRVLVRLRG